MYVVESGDDMQSSVVYVVECGDNMQSSVNCSAVLIRVGQKIKIFDLGFPIRRAFAEWC